MGRIAAAIAAAALVLPGCDRPEKPDMPKVEVRTEIRGDDRPGASTGDPVLERRTP